MVGIDPESDGLKRAKEMGLKTTAEGVDGLIPTMKKSTACKSSLTPPALTSTLKTAAK